MTNSIIVGRISECMRLQDSFNKKVNPNWKTAGYPFYRAAWLELAEAMGPTDWKWWKKQTDDRYQTKLEMVDIFHFALSDAIIKGTPPENIASIWLFSESRFPQSRKGDIEYAFEQAEGFMENATGLRKIDFSNFFKLMICLDITLEDVLKLYVSKNVLNVFRQDHGYKEGTYIKEWFGVEDNKFLEEVMTENPEISYDALYNALKAQYKLVTNQTMKEEK